MLANEEVIDSKSGASHYLCERRPLRRWVLRITAYADRLLNDLDQVPIGPEVDQDDDAARSGSGAAKARESIFGYPGSAFTEASVRRADETCPSSPASSKPATDTLFGAHLYGAVAGTFATRSDSRLRNSAKAVARVSKAEAAKKSDMERTELAKKKTGVSPGRSLSIRSTKQVDPGLDRRLRLFWPATAPARSWPCRGTMSVTSVRPAFKLPIPAPSFGRPD